LFPLFSYLFSFLFSPTLSLPLHFFPYAFLLITSSCSLFLVISFRFLFSSTVSLPLHFFPFLFP
jgi:hypothetical protein